MSASNPILIDQLLGAAPVLPVLSIARLSDAVPLARALVEAGLTVLEITLRSEAALAAIEAIARAVPEAIVGAGTVLKRADLLAVADAGARFAISPGATPMLYQDALDSRIPWIPAIATASELMQGLEFGYTRFKFFPAASSGGVAALKAFAGPFPRVRFCPTGGIDLAQAPAYLKLPNVILVGGSWMAPADLLDAGDWAGIARLARAAAALRTGL